MKTILLNPFKKYQEKLLVLIGVVATLIGSFVGYLFKARFDGVLDLHLVQQISLWSPFIDNLVNIGCLTIFLFFAAKYSNAKTRFIDIFTSAIIARLPYYLLPLLNFNNIVGKASSEIMKTVAVNPLEINITPTDLIPILVFALFSIVALIWYIALLFNGYKVASNAKGGKPILLFIVALMVSEIVSKLIISTIAFC